MKLRKILAGFLAGAVAMTSMVVTSVTASAAAGDSYGTYEVAFDVSDISAATSLSGLHQIQVSLMSADSTEDADINWNYGFTDVTVELDDVAVDLSGKTGYGVSNNVKLLENWDAEETIENLTSASELKITFNLTDTYGAGEPSGYICILVRGSDWGTYTVATPLTKATTDEPSTPAATDPYIYTYDGSPVELTVAAASWAPNGYAAQNNMALSPTGFTAQTTTFAELKELYSGITVKDWAITNVPDGVVADNIAVSVYIQYKSDWSGWAATDGTSVTFADLTAIADTDPIMAIGFQLNYNLSADDTATYKAGDVITVNGAEEEGFDQTEEAVEEAAKNGTVLMQTATFGDVEAVRYTKVVSLEEIKNAAKVTFTFESKDANGNVIGTGTYTSTNYYTSLMASGASVNAPSDCGFLSLTVTGIPDGVTLTCTGITLS